MSLLKYGLLLVVAHLTYGQVPFGAANAGFRGIGSGIGLQWGAQPFESETITCTFSDMATVAGSVTLKRSQPEWGGWGWGRAGLQLTGTYVVRTAAATTGTFSLALTERARDNECSTDSLGPVISSSARRQGWWGNPWTWGSGSSMTSTVGEIVQVTLAGSDDQTIDIPADRLPLRQLRQYAGRSFAMCTSFTTGSNGRLECTSPIGCCKLRFNNQDAVTPTLS